MNKILTTGSAGLIGSEVSTFFTSNGWHVIGVDNIMMGPKADPCSGWYRNARLTN